jgi:transposase-like protein
MTTKRYTTAEKTEMVKEALDNEKNKKISVHQSSRKFEVSDVSLYRWIRQYKRGELKEESDISPDLMSELEEGFNGPLGKLDIVVTLGDSLKEIVAIDDPGLQDYDDQMTAIKERVFSQFDIFIKV